MTIVLALLLTVALRPASAATQDQAANPRPTLYERLGGYDGIASYVALVFPRVAQHPDLDEATASAARSLAG
jgi:hypothetical protein